MSPERKLEARLVKYCKAHGLYCRKFVSPGCAGVPDRIIVGPCGTLFVELKSPGESPDPLQCYELHRIRKVGGRASWASDWPRLKRLVDSLIPTSIL